MVEKEGKGMAKRCRQRDIGESEMQGGKGGSTQISTFPVHSSKCFDQIPYDSLYSCGETNYVAITLQ